MNTPICTNKKQYLPKIPNKIKPSNNIGFHTLNKINKNLGEEFGFAILANYKSGKIFPEINVTYPLTPKKKINVPRFNLSSGELNDIRTNLFYEDNNCPGAPRIPHTSHTSHTSHTPRAPHTTPHTTPRAPHTTHTTFTPCESYVSCVPLTTFTQHTTHTTNNNIQIPKTSIKKFKNEQDMFLDNIEDYIYDDSDYSDNSDNDSIDNIDDYNDLKNVKKQLVFNIF